MVDTGWKTILIAEQIERKAVDRKCPNIKDDVYHHIEKKCNLKQSSVIKCSNQQ
jgi:hypothetical protein